MKRSARLYFSCFSLIALQVWLQSVWAEDAVVFSVKPSRCVALREGQVCYQHVIFKWTAKQVSDYCLYEKSSNKELKCWKQVSRGRHKIDFQSAKTQSFELREWESQSIIAIVDVTVAWVYKSSKRPRSNWRVF